MRLVGKTLSNVVMTAGDPGRVAVQLAVVVPRMFGRARSSSSCFGVATLAAVLVAFAPDDARADERESSPAAPRYRGTGLFIGAGIASAGALVLSSFAATDRCTHYEDCLVFAPALSNFAAGASAVGLPLAAGGGILRGRYDRARALSRKPVTFQAIGGTLLGVGVVASAVLRTFAARPQLLCDVDDAGEYDCAERVNDGSTVGAYLGEASAIAGGALLGYGLTTKRSELAFEPMFSRERVGLAIRVRW